MAAGEGRLQLVKLLLHHGADPAAVDNRGNTGAGEVSGQPPIVPLIMKHSEFYRLTMKAMLAAHVRNVVLPLEILVCKEAAHRTSCGEAKEADTRSFIGF